jgi:pimeloyl-ACP methyl ester carboxylesterase
MSVFEFKGVNFFFIDENKGPAILFLHGFLEDHSMWQGIISALPKSYRKLAIDLPGHGQSGNLGYIHTMEEMAEVIKGLLDELKIKKAFLVGHSMGGYVSLAIAEMYPDLVKGIVLMNSNARADSPSKKKDRDRAIKVVKENHKAFIRVAIPNLFRPKNRRILRETVNEVKAKALKTSKQGIIAALEGMKIRPDREVLLHFGPYPVLLIAGKNDPAIPYAIVEEQLQAENVTPLITENGHMAHLEDTEEVVKGIKKFLYSKK